MFSEHQNMKLYLCKGKISDRKVKFGENNTRKVWKHVCLKINAIIF